MPLDNKKLNLLSEDTKAILSYVPHWMIRWGNVVIFLIVLLAFLLAYMVRYPDVIPARVVLTTEEPVLKVNAPTSGIVHKNFIQNLDTITQDAPIFIVKSRLNWENLKKLELMLSDLSQIRNAPFNIGTFDSITELAELQNHYDDLVQDIKAYNYKNKTNITSQQNKSTSSQIQSYTKLNKSIIEQYILMSEEMKLMEINLDRNKKLFEAGTISTFDLEKVKSEYLQFKRNLERLNAQLNNNDLQIEQLKMRQLELDKNFDQTKSNEWYNIQEKIKQLKNSIGDWEKQFLVVAPISGLVSYLNFESQKQFVNQGEDLLKILPGGKANKVIGKATLPMAGSGKIQPTMLAQVYLDGYPYDEFGVLDANVASIAPVPNENTYLLKLEIDSTFITSYNKKIEFKQEMSGTVEIVTKDLSVLDRLFYQLRAIFE